MTDGHFMHLIKWKEMTGAYEFHMKEMFYVYTALVGNCET